jgi:hypothetical protein
MDGTSTPEGRTGLGLPAEPPGTPRRAITGFLALARFLLAESPGRAEQFSGDVPELRRIIERDRGVIRYPEPSGPMYISVRDGLRTTSADPPAWADPAEIIDLPERPPPGQVLLARLRAAADGIRALDRDRHATYRVADTVRAVEERYGDVLTADTAGCLKAIAAEPVLDTRSRGSSGLDGFGRLTDHVLAGYQNLMLSGEAVQRMIALTMLMEVAGDLAGDALAAEVNPLGYNLTYPARLEAWVLSLPRSTAPVRIYDVSSQLGYPDVVRDVALAVADLAAGREEQCAQRAAAAARQMAAPAALPLVVEWGLGYFSYTAALAQRVLERLGRAAEAAELARYNDRTWLAEQMTRFAP